MLSELFASLHVFSSLTTNLFYLQTRSSIASPLYLCDRNHEPDKHLVDQLLKDQRWTTWRWPRTVQLHDIQYSVLAIFSAITMSTSPFIIYERSLCFCLLLSLCYIAPRWCYRRLYYRCPLSFALVSPFSTQWWQYSEVLLGNMLELIPDSTLRSGWPRFRHISRSIFWNIP